MKPQLLLFLAALLLPVVATYAADEPAAATSPAKPELRGILVMAGNDHFLLAAPGSKSSQWVAIGDKFGDWTVDSFNEKDEALTLRSDDGGHVTLYTEAATTGQGAPQMADLAMVRRMMDKLHFAQMLQKIIEGQQAAQFAAIRQSLKSRGMSDEKIDAIIAKQTQMADRLWANVSMQDLQDTMAQIYSEEFTQDQLDGISAFYDSPAGQASIEKAPDIQAKIMQAIMPKLLAAQQQMQAEAKAAPAAPAAPAAAPAPKG